MNALYWVTKYVSDLIRNEPRNIGVIASKDGTYAAKFMGEREDGALDFRRLGTKFDYPQVYAQWRNFWRDQVSKSDLREMLDTPKSNYYVEFAGEVVDTGSDSAEDVCQFLYTMLVGGGAAEAFGLLDEQSEEADLASEIVQALSALDLLASGQDLLARHPVVRGRDILGQHVMHTPSFSQGNGKLHVIEYIDLSGRRADKIKERAGWMAYMFSDIRGIEQQAEFYSIIRPELAKVGSAEYAKTVLSGESKLVNWGDDCEREKFLEERRRIADSV